MAGDSILAVFETAAASVSTALAIQDEVNALADEVPEERRMRFRIGIHLGDVIEKADGTVYGDGVNIAARLQAAAESGEIAVSDSIRSAVKGRLRAHFEDQGERSFKNIAEPVRVWKLSSPQATQAHGSYGTKEPGTALSRKPSIAVRPFANLSGDPEQQYFSDGITEDIITDLSKNPELLVIARNTSFAPKYKGVDIRTVGRELGVTSMLEGSIRRAGMRVRITAQLVDTATGTNLWSERFDRDVTDVFAIQDEVTRHIVEALAITLRQESPQRQKGRRPRSAEAYDRVLFGYELLRSGKEPTRELFAQIVGALRRAIELDPDFADPYAGIALVHCLDFQNRVTGTPNVLDLAAALVEQAIEKGPDEPVVRFVAANVAVWRGDLPLARAEADRTLALNPNYAMAYALRGNIELYIGNAAGAFPYLERAMLLDPVFDHQNQHFLGTACLVAGRFEAAANAFRERIRLSPKTDLSRAFLASALGHLGALDEARQVWRELQGVNPKYSLAAHLERLPFLVDGDRERIREGVVLAKLVD